MTKKDGGCAVGSLLVLYYIRDALADEMRANDVMDSILLQPPSCAPRHNFVLPLSLDFSKAPDPSLSELMHRDVEMLRGSEPF